jgi:hypothetical protein
MQTLQEIQHDKLVKVLKQEYVHKKYYCSIKRFYNWKIFKRWYYNRKQIRKYWKEYHDIENI